MTYFIYSIEPNGDKYLLYIEPTAQKAEWAVQYLRSTGHRPAVLARRTHKGKH